MLKNLAPGTVLLIGALSLTAGWLAGTSSSSSQQQDVAGARSRMGPRPVGTSGTSPLPRQLRQRLDTPPRHVPATGRNPFVFGARRAPSGTGYRGEPRVSEPPAPPPVAFTPPAPQIKLSGIAASQEGDVTVLTAIISDNGALVFVKVGDKLPSGATVSKIEDSGIILVGPAGLTQTIKLP